MKLRDYLRKSRKTGPGSHGATQWYVNDRGQVIYGLPSSRRVKNAFWGNHVNPLLTDLEYGWNDGGCWLAAEALRQWFGEHPSIHAEMAVLHGRYRHGADQTTPQHVALKVTLPHHEPLYLDSEGISTERDLRGRWEREEGMRDITLQPMSRKAVQERAAGITIEPQHLARVVALLGKKLGSFSGVVADDR